MITGKLKNTVDTLWLSFYSQGITNPLSVIEQISYLMFARLLDIAETRNEKRAQRLKTGDVNHLFSAEQQHLRWGNFTQESDPNKMLAVVRDEVFPFFQNEVVKRTALGQHLRGAQCLITGGGLLAEAVATINTLPLAQGDTKGDLYEYLLSKLTSAGIAGQFRTPRHIIRAMVEMIDPKPDERIGDPACGTGGFLIGAMEYLNETYSSPELVHVETDDDGQETRTYPGDLLELYRKHIQNDMFYGWDFDHTMLRIAAMNLLLHGIESPAINYQDTLNHSFTEKFGRQSSDFFDVVLANPPFKGQLDAENVHSSLKSKVKTRKTELLFLALMVRMLKNGGRCAVIVPDGVLFGSSRAHLGIRQMLVDENQLEAVVSLPSGVFKPYAGVSTAILVFTKGGRTDNIWFYKVEADGYSLDDKRTPGKDNDLPDLVAQWKVRDPKKHTNRAKKAFFVPVDEIRDNRHDLSINRYKEIEYEEVQYDPPHEILDRLETLEGSIVEDITSLREMLK